MSRRFCDEQRKAVWVKVYPIKELPDSKEILDFLRKQLAVFNKSNPAMRTFMKQMDFEEIHDPDDTSTLLITKHLDSPER